MTDSYIVQRVARAMVESRPIPEGHLRGDVNWDFFEDLARAALKETADYIDQRYGNQHPGALCIRHFLQQAELTGDDSPQ